MDTEWKAEISRKLESLSELSRLRKDVQRITVELEKLAGIESESQDGNGQEVKNKEIKVTDGCRVEGRDFKEVGGPE